MDFCHSDLGKKKCSLDVSSPYLNRAQLKSQPSKLRGKNQSMAMVLCCQRGWLLVLARCVALFPQVEKHSGN